MEIENTLQFQMIPSNRVSETLLPILGTEPDPQDQGNSITTYPINLGNSINRWGDIYLNNRIYFSGVDYISITGTGDNAEFQLNGSAISNTGDFITVITEEEAYRNDEEGDGVASIFPNHNIALLVDLGKSDSGFTRLYLW